jgi:hypothetical protein
MTAELEIYRRLGLPLIYWKRQGDDPRKWKGPHDKGWNDPRRVYDWTRYDPAIHNVGTLTGCEIAPRRYLTDIDLDKLIRAFLVFFPATAFILTRPGKEPSHLFYTTPTPLDGKREYLSPSDEKPYSEMRGTRHQTMLAPSLHTPPDIRVRLLASDCISHVEHLDVLMNATLDYSIASLVAEMFPGGLHHDIRLPLAGYLLKRQCEEDRVRKLLQTICEYQVECRVPDMSEYDIDDVAPIVTSTVERLTRGEEISGGHLLREINTEFLKRLQSFLPRTEGPIRVDDFHAYMPKHVYLFMPSGEFWPASSVNARVEPITTMDPDGHEKKIAPSVWLDRHRPVEQMCWAPGHPPIIRDRLVSDGGWIERVGCSVVNRYRPPQIALGDAENAYRWLALIRALYPHHADHIVQWFAHRVQRPGEKVNHALVLGGVSGIGKDALQEPVKSAVGPWNFAEISPKHLLGRFNGFAESVILRVSEVRDLGDMNRYDFYEHTKTYIAAPPDVLRVDEKNIPEHPVFNVCGVVFTTNHEDGMYLPPDDRRHFVVWSELTPSDFPDGYWADLFAWYANGGRGHVAAYLAQYDLSQFDPKAPPPKTEAFWTAVNANRSTADAELADVLEALDNPRAITLRRLIDKCPLAMKDLSDWLADRKNARQIPHRMKAADYVPFRNAGAKDGLWKVDDRRQVIYVRQELNERERSEAAKALIEGPANTRALELDM